MSNLRIERKVAPKGMEVFTYTDKDQRDRTFLELRAAGDQWERQAVKFSGFEPILGANGEQLVLTREYWLDGSKHPKVQLRPVFRSTWSIAHPKQAV